MKKQVFGFLVGLAVLVLAGCESTTPILVNSNTAGTKVGEATGSWMFNGMIGGNVDVSLQTAAKNGGITKIATVDVRVKDVLGFMQTYTTVVTGE